MIRSFDCPDCAKFDDECVCSDAVTDPVDSPSDQEIQIFSRVTSYTTPKPTDDNPDLTKILAGYFMATSNEFTAIAKQLTAWKNQVVRAELEDLRINSCRDSRDFQEVPTTVIEEAAIQVRIEQLNKPESVQEVTE